MAEFHEYPKKPDILDDQKEKPTGTDGLTDKERRNREFEMGNRDQGRIIGLDGQISTVDEFDTDADWKM